MTNLITQIKKNKTHFGHPKKKKMNTTFKLKEKYLKKKPKLAFMQ